VELEETYSNVAGVFQNTVKKLVSKLQICFYKQLFWNNSTIILEKTKLLSYATH